MTQTSIRFASFNASLNRNSAGQLITDLSTPNNTQAQNVAEIIQRTNPDVVLINEFDYYENGQAAELFRQNYLQVGQNGATPVDYPYFYVAPSNTGVPSGFDLDNNGTVGGSNDALGFGFFPGQFGMVLFSKYPIDFDNVRTFQEFLWKDMPGALLPDDPTTPAPNDFYSPEELEIFRLSSKSHWDVPINVNGEIVHVLASHPTPPVFDGSEDRNGTRNFDEIRFWKDYITPGQGDYIYDDNGSFGGLTPGARFVIMGDQNSDPLDGDSIPGAIQQLLDNPLVNTSTTPNSAGGTAAAERQGGANDTHQSDPTFDTADFADTTPGNLRADYVLPSNNLSINGAGVFWPTPDDPLFRLVGDFDPTIPGGFPSSDHRLVYVDVTTPGIARNSVSNINFLGEVTFPTGFQFDGTTVGGLSGIAYDHEKGVYYSISDDRSQFNPARFYTLDINLSDGKLDDGDVSFLDFTTLLDANGNPFTELSLDPEAIALTNDGTVFITSEGEASAARLTNPFINEFNLTTGRQVSSLPVPRKFLPELGVSGIRNNLAFESLTITPNQRYLFTATENALVQDGPAASLTDESPARIIQYDLVTGQPVQEFVYFTDPVAAAPNPAGSFSTNGLVELLAIDNTGTLLALERSFSTGVGNSIKLYQVQTQGAVDVSSLNSVNGLEPDPAVEKKLLLDFADLGITLDNIEGLTFGPKLADGRQSLIIVSDNNFSATQTTQILAFAVDIDTIPAAAPTVETPPLLDIAPEDRREGQQIGDADDPAIYVHPTDSSKSFVIGSFKEGGLSVYDLNGDRLQKIQRNGTSYNNVDLIYGFNLGGRLLDLAIASDRANDTVAIFRVDPDSRRLIGISGNLPKSIFGVDDGEQTAYGLAAYTSPVTGKSYVFVSQASGNQIAQIELIAQGKERISAKVVRTFEVPIPDGLEREDAQVEGMVVDRERGILYVGQEQFGIYKFSAEPNGSTEPVLVDAIANGNLQPDIEGLTIYYGANGKGYLIASSQGDNTFAVYSRDTNQYLGSFAVGSSNGIDSAEESDGADVINVPLGPQFPFGMLVVQDGNNDPQTIINDDGEIENASGNFKFVPWENVANSFFNTLDIDTSSYNPRDPITNLLNDGVSRQAPSAIAGGDALLYGGNGRNSVTDGSGGDVFLLTPGSDVAIVTDFSNDDRIGLAAGLSFGQLTIAQGSGSNFQDTIISVAGEELAVLTGVQANSLSSDSFVLA
jgi:3-phytase